MTDLDLIKVHATSTEATFPNAAQGPWETWVEEFYLKNVSGEGVMYRVQARSPERDFPRQLGTLEDTLEAALKKLAEQERLVRESGVTAETPRLGRCAYCKSVSKELMLWTSRPFHEFEDNYDGCRGWD